MSYSCAQVPQALIAALSSTDSKNLKLSKTRSVLFYKIVRIRIGVCDLREYRMICFDKKAGNEQLSRKSDFGDSVPWKMNGA